MKKHILATTLSLALLTIGCAIQEDEPPLVPASIRVTTPEATGIENMDILLFDSQWVFRDIVTDQSLFSDNEHKTNLELAPVVPVRGETAMSAISVKAKQAAGTGKTYCLYGLKEERIVADGGNDIAIALQKVAGISTGITVNPWTERETGVEL